MRHLRQLLKVLEKDIKKWIGETRPIGSNGQPVQWDGKSYAFTEYFKQNRIDPKFHPRYSKYYVNQRHSIAGSYVWGDSTLSEFADELEKPMHFDKRCWIDVLISRQFDLDSDNVVGLTGDIYSGCDVLILLSDTIFRRAWCLLEAAHYTTKGCNIFVAGQCSFLQDEDYFAAMRATVPSDERLIKDEIAKMFGADCQAKFNRAIDDAVVQVYGESLLYNGRFQEAVPVFEKELDVKRRRGDDEGSVASTYKQMGRASFSLGKYDEALTYYDEALQRFKRCDGNGHVRVAETEEKMANVYLFKGELNKALETYKRVLKTKKCKCGPADASVADTYVNWANVEAQLENFLMALKLYEKALEIYKQTVGSSNVSVGDAYVNMGVLERKLGNFGKALGLYENALDIFIKCYGRGHLDVASTQMNMGIILKQQGKFDEALKLYKGALEIMLGAYGGPTHMNVANTYCNMGVVYDKVGNFEKALEMYEMDLQITRQCMGDNHESVAMTQENIGYVYKKLGDLAQARLCFDEAHRIFVQRLGPTHSNTQKAARALEQLQQQ